MLLGNLLQKVRPCNGHRHVAGRKVLTHCHHKRGRERQHCNQQVISSNAQQLAAAIEPDGLPAALLILIVAHAHDAGAAVVGSTCIQAVNANSYDRQVTC